MRHSKKEAATESLPRGKKEMEWNNTDNNVFYENIKADGLREIAEKGGLASGCDLEQLTPYWSKAKSILEVGAGYGRVINYLLKHQYQGKITAIERCNVLFEYIEKNYSTYKNIKLIHADVRYLNLENIDERFDLILMLWSGISDFSSNEQLIVIKKLAKLLYPTRKLIVDSLPSSTAPLNSEKKKDRLYTVKVNDAEIKAYVPDMNEIEKYAKNAGFSNVSCTQYLTQIGRERCLYILS